MAYGGSSWINIVRTARDDRYGNLKMVLKTQWQRMDCPSYSWDVHPWEDMLVNDETEPRQKSRAARLSHLRKLTLRQLDDFAVL